MRGSASRWSWRCDWAKAWCWPATSIRRERRNVWRDLLFSTRYACPDCGISYAELEPRTFSFNSPYGVCPACEGLGATVEFDPDLVIPDPDRSLNDGACRPLAAAAAGEVRKYLDELAALRRPGSSTWTHRWPSCRPAVRQQLLYGNGNGQRFPGVLTWLKQEFATTTDRSGRSSWRRFGAASPARRAADPGCGRKRTACGWPARSIGQITALTVTEALRFFRRIWSFRRPIAPISDPSDRRDLPATCLPRSRRCQLPGTRSAGRHVEWWRVAARAAGHQHRFGPGRRLLRARRTVDRAAPARQPAV